MTYSTRSARFRKGLAVVAGGVMIAAASAPLDAAERIRGSSTRSGASASSGVSSTSSSSSTRSGTTATMTRSRGNSDGGVANRAPSSRTPRHRYSYDRNYRHSYWSPWRYWWGSFGYYPYWGHYYPYHAIFPTLYYGVYGGYPGAGEYRDYRLGALDLNVKPKKTEVWVDGQLVGLAGKFDGFPGYLWLDRGRHQLVFHKPGFETEVREVRVLQGTVVRVQLRLEPGESTPPEEIARVPAQRQRRPSRARAEGTREQEVRPVRAEPGRLRLSIEPGDASVYLDGRFLGTGEELSALHAGLLVTEGDHTIEIVRPGYQSASVDLTISADVEEEMAVVLALE